MRLDKGQIEVVDDKVAEILKRKPGHERIKMVWDAWASYRQRIEVYLQELHPEWTQEKLQKEIARRISHGTR